MRRGTFRQSFILLALALLPALVSAALQLDLTFSKTRHGEVTLATVSEWGDDVLWVDARRREQFETSHIPGAVLLNEDEWGSQFGPFLNAWQPEKRVVVYCDSLQCRASHEVAERLRTEAGISEVYVLQGGWEEWQRVH